MTAHRTRASLALVTAMFFWGTSAVFLRTTALTLAPENALALRYMMLVLLFGTGLALTGQWRIARPDWPRLLVTALAGMFGSSWFTVQGYARVAAGLGTVIQVVEPIILAFLASMVLRETPSKRIWLGLAVSIVGGVVLFWPDVSAITTQPVDRWGITALIGASTCWAIYTIGAKPLLVRYSSFTITAWAMILSSPLVLLMASKPYDELLRTTPSRSWLEILYIAVFNSIVGNVLWTFGARHLSGAAVGSFLYLMPVFAVAAGFLWLGEPITPYLVAGGSILLMGVALAQSGSETH